MLHLIARAKFYMANGKARNQHTFYSLFYRRWIVRAGQRVLVTDEGMLALKNASNTERSAGAIDKDFSPRVQRAIRGLSVMKRSA